MTGWLATEVAPDGSPVAFYGGVALDRWLESPGWFIATPATAIEA